ncbi:MAG TPA: DUF6279 family lipoprotein, partial [Methylibium sp.]
ARTNRKFRDEYLQSDLAERREAFIKRVAERAELLYGSLTDSQRELVGREVDGSPFDPQLWDTQRRHNQQALLQALRQIKADRASPEQSITVLRPVFRRWADPPDAEYRRYWQRLIAYNCEFAARLHNATTPAQRARALEKLRGWEQDLRILAGPEANAASPPRPGAG